MQTCRKARGIVSALTLTLVLSACGGGDDPSASAGGAAPTAGSGGGANGSSPATSDPTVNYPDPAGPTTGVPDTKPEWIDVADSQQAVAGGSYRAVNEQTQAGITLPPNEEMTPGATVRVKGAGAGGWKIVQKSGQQVQGLSAPGANWKLVDQHTWTSMASSDDGTRLVAADAGGGKSYAYTSMDGGLAWTLAPLDVREGTSTWVASSMKGDMLTVAAYGQGIYTYRDDVAKWSLAQSGDGWTSLASSSDGQTRVATTGWGGVLASINEESWVRIDKTLSSSYTLDHWKAVAITADGTKLVAAPSSGDASFHAGDVYTATKGATGWEWKTHSAPASTEWSSVAFVDANTLLAGESNGRLFISIDGGDSWNAIGPVESMNWTSLSVAADGKTMLAGTANGKLYVSTNGGQGWDPTGPSGMNWRSVLCSADGTRFFASGSALTGSPAESGTYTGSTVTTRGTGSISGGAYDAIDLVYVDAGVFKVQSRTETVNWQ